MGSERRNCARRILYSPEYLDMGVDNGGVVVDLSEGGLRFQAVGRVEANADVPLSFSLGTGYRIDVEARIVWVSPRGNSGGVVFKKLSSDSRSLIREWLAKPEEEHRAEAAIATPETEEDQQVPSAAVVAKIAGSTNPASVTAPAVSAPVAVSQPLAGEAFEDRSQGARIEEIFAPGPILAEDVPLPQQEIAARPLARTAQVPPQSPAVSNSPATRANTRRFAPQSIRPAVPAQTPPHQKSSPAVNASFSVVPSISQWASKGSSAPRVPARTNPLQSGAPLFPPHGSENIFARNRWEPPEIEESHAGRKLLVIVLLLVVLGAVLLGVAYENGYREQIGAAIERVGSTVAGGPNDGTSSAPASASSSPADSPSNAAPSSVAPKNTSPSAAPQSAPSVAPAQAAPTPSAPPNTSTATNSSPSPTNAAQQNPAHPAPPTSDPSASQDSAAPAHSGSSPNQDAAQKPGQKPSQPADASAPSSAALAESAAQSEFLRAQQYLTGSGVPQDPATAAEWFWRSLEAGNTAAAVPLADLYIAGKGVSRSCQQARILLDTAARKGNAEAVHKLAELPAKCE